MDYGNSFVIVLGWQRHAPVAVGSSYVPEIAPATLHTSIANSDIGLVRVQIEIAHS